MATRKKPDPHKYVEVHMDDRGHRAARQTYTMTAAEFRALGGLDAVPSQYDPGAARAYSREHKSGGLGHLTVQNHTDPNGWVPPTMEALQALADAHHVHLLTIHWPDKYSPDFTARPKE